MSMTISGLPCIGGCYPAGHEPVAYATIECCKSEKVNGGNMRLGPGEIILCFLILLLLFGGRKLPQLAEGMGKALKNFRKAVQDNDKEAEKEDSGE